MHAGTTGRREEGREGGRERWNERQPVRLGRRKNGEATGEDQNARKAEYITAMSH